MLKIKKIDTIEVLVDSASNTYALDPTGSSAKNISGGTVTAIAVHSVASIAKGLDNKKANVPDVTRAGAYLDLAFEGRGKVATKIPLTILDPKNNQGEFVSLEPGKIDLANCEIRIPDTAVLTLDTTFIISFLYE